MMKALSSSDAEESVSYFPVIMFEYFQILQSPKTDLKKAFSSLLDLLRG